MRYWQKSLKQLTDSDKSLSAIFDIICSYRDNVFFEKLNGTIIEKTTFGEFGTLATKAAASIKQKLNLPFGAFVGMEMNNSPTFVIIFWGLLMAGYKPLLINIRLTADQKQRIIADADAQAIIADVVVRDIDYDAQDFLKDNTQAFVPTWENYFALTTSGTSSEPKIYLYDGQSLSAQIFNSKYVWKKNPSIESYYKGKIKQLAFLPFYHIFGLVATLMWFSFFGRTFVFLNDMRPETIIYACKRHGVTHLFAIPLLFNSVAAHIRREAKLQGTKTAARLDRALNFSIKLQNIFPRFSKFIIANTLFKGLRSKLLGPSVKFCICGGGYIKEDALRVFNGLGYSLYNGYGMTEAGIVSVELRKTANARMQGSVGIPFPSTQAALDSDGRLLLKGDSLHQAQLKDGQIIARDKSSFFDTSDIFEIDQKGNYFIKGRLDDIIIADNGELLAPDLIEKNFDVPYALAYTVVGLRTENEKTEIALVIYPDPKASEMQIDSMLANIYHTNAKLPVLSRITAVFLTSEPLPLALESKVQRSALKRRLLEGTIAHTKVTLSRYASFEQIQNQNYNKTLKAVKDIFGFVLALDSDEILDTSNFLLDLGGSSLEYFSLLEELSQKFNVTFKLEETFLATPNEFAAYICKLL